MILDIENLDEMLMHVHNTSHLGRKELFSEFLLFDIKTNTNEDFKSIFPAFYDDLRNYLIIYMKTMKHDLNEEILKHIYIRFTLTGSVSYRSYCAVGNPLRS